MEKGKWISAKIRELEHENKGRGHEQNIAIAFSMWNNMKEEGGEQLPQYQKGTWKEKLPEYWTVEQQAAHQKKAYGDKQTSDAGYTLSPEISKVALPGMTQAFGGPSTSAFGNKNYGIPVTTGGTPAVNNFNFATSYVTPANTPTPVPTAAPAETDPVLGEYFKNYKLPIPPSFDVNMPQGFPQQTSALSEGNLTAGEDWAAKNPLPEFQTESGKFNYDPNAVNAEKFSSSLGEITDKYKEKDKTGTDVSVDTTDYHRQFYNPYGGIDLETSLVGLGQGIQNKDTKAIVANSLLAGLKGTKDVFGGMGLANRENQVMQDYWDQQREGMIGRAKELENGGYFQDGGEQFQNPQEEGQEQQGGQQEQMMQQIAQAIQGGATPEQVVQKLVESGIPQEQAVQMVQAVMQQLQGQQQQQAPQEQPQMKNGGEYLSALKGNRIKDYKLDTKTNMYTVEYE